jgi:multiple sugar transport system ATP-binding protein
VDNGDESYWPLENKKVAKAERDRRIKDAASILGLTEALGRKPQQLSGGQRQRGAMGRAIVREPSVFLISAVRSISDNWLTSRATRSAR